MACSSLILLAIACGSDDETSATGAGGGGPVDPFGPSCDSEGCRGDPTGQWSVASACAVDDSVPEPDDCAGFSCQISASEPSGSYDFGADGMASFQWALTLAALCTVPKSCFVESSCADLDTAERSCSDAGDSCSCEGSYENEGARTGSWNTNNGLLSIEDGVGMTGTTNWCVIDDAMAINVLANFDGQFGSLLGAVGLTKVRLTLRP